MHTKVLFFPWPVCKLLLALQDAHELLSNRIIQGTCETHTFLGLIPNAPNTDFCCCQAPGAVGGEVGEDSLCSQDWEGAATDHAL